MRKESDAPADGRGAAGEPQGRARARPTTLQRCFRRLCERVMERDRAYFHANHDAGSYVRPYVPAECWPHREPASHALVAWHAPGTRSQFSFTNGGAL